MRPIREYDQVRIIKLLTSSRDVLGSEPNARQPQVGDVATVCHEYAPHDPTARLAVEKVAPDGRTIWLADFEREELELVTLE